MSKRKIINVGVEIHELYQLLISECRYGYTRNNHLMPWGAYDKVKRYLPLMFKKDPEAALHTACQICDECSSEQIVRNFYDGLDDEESDALEEEHLKKYGLNHILRKDAPPEAVAAWKEDARQSKEADARGMTID